MQQLDKGADLERRIEAFFRLNGYETSRNAFREGRSGARHELDVLAVKSDGVTEFTVLIECKAWGMPIAKEVVSKLSMITTDLGINKAIIVSLNGWTTGAELTAKQLGIELWGSEEIQNRLGQVAVAELELGPSNRTGMGLSLGIEEAAAAPRLIASARGFLGLGREEVVWLRIVWLPFFLTEMSHTKSRSTLLKGTVTETTKSWNLYDGISGRLFVTFDEPPELTEVVLGHTVPARAQPRKIQREISDTIKKARSVVTQKAQARHGGRLAELGVPMDSEATTVDRVEEVRVPFYVALLRSGARQRLLTIDGVWGRRRSHMDAGLTENSAYLIEALPQPDPVAAPAVPPTAGVPSRAWLVTLLVIAVAEYALYRADMGSFLTAYAVTLAVIILGAYKRWQDQQR